MTPEEEPDVTFTSTVRAEELTFDEVPETHVEFTGDTDDRSTSGSDRTNLPRPVEPHVTYRDIRVDYRIEAYLDEDAPEP
ncbi:hypothetical protein [Saccharopolyspora hordei]|uniref:Uncharacterized protein n=1 Tax=Saccharopolyspora hordei TaxID=1838 RepID=A0A853ARG5_9PSEU|nr:hypothetical protein [Saccharopolyspora hordei]NYI83980.1 hypothetical protein [Saccharopolyspora hordei]